MIDLQTVTQFVLANFQQVTIKNNGQHFLCRCPLCGDSRKNIYKKRFNLNWNFGVPGYHCFNCGKQGNFIELFSFIKGISYDDAKKELFKYDKGNIKNRLESKQVIEEKKEVITENFNWILEQSYSLNSKGDGILFNKYMEVLRNFYIDRKIPKEYKIYICNYGKYKNRIIIPIFDENKNVIYFQARRIPGSNIEPKYDNPVSPKEQCILNKFRFDKECSIAVTEGLIDGFMIGNQGTSCLGKEVSENLILELFKHTNKDIIVALDNDEEAYKSLSKFMQKNKYAKKLKYFLYPTKFSSFKDINSIVTNYKEKIDVYEMIINNSVNYSTALIKLKLMKLI
jgi:CHC2 zinc finger